MCPSLILEKWRVLRIVIIEGYHLLELTVHRLFRVTQQNEGGGAPWPLAPSMKKTHL
jgi:hypothetical protein